MPRYIIRRIRLAHCKRGPDRCVKCEEMDVETICLLDIAPPDAGMIQRRVIEVNVGGESLWREFDIVRSFDHGEQARTYAREHGVDDIQV